MIEDFSDKTQPEGDIRIHFNEDALNSAKIRSSASVAAEATRSTA
jgi:hypothetical protein